MDTARIEDRGGCGHPVPGEGFDRDGGSVGPSPEVQAVSSSRERKALFHGRDGQTVNALACIEGENAGISLVGSLRIGAAENEGMKSLGVGNGAIGVTGGEEAIRLFAEALYEAAGWLLEMAEDQVVMK